MRKGDQVKVIEVKTRASLAATSRIDELARAIDAKPGWSFELLLVWRSRRSWSHPRRLSRSSASTFLSGSTRLRRSWRQGTLRLRSCLYGRPARLPLRLAIADQEGGNEGITTAAHTLGQAAYLGVISRAEYGQLTELQRHRNAIVHGFSHGDFGETPVRELIDLVRGMTAATA